MALNAFSTLPNFKNGFGASLAASSAPSVVGVQVRETRPGTDLRETARSVDHADQGREEDPSDWGPRVSLWYLRQLIRAVG